MVEQNGRFRVDVYGPGKKKFFVIGKREEPLIPDESRFFEFGEVTGSHQFPDFGFFGVVNNDDELTLIGRTNESIFIKDNETRELKKHRPLEDFERPISGAPVSLISLKTQRQLVITLDREPPQEVAVGAKPISPKPTLSTSVALTAPRTQHRFSPDTTRSNPGDKPDWHDKPY